MFDSKCSLGVAMIALLVGHGCGSDSDGGGPSGESGATQSVESAASLKGVSEDPMSELSVAGVTKLHADLQQIVAAKQVTDVQGSTLTARPSALAVVQQALFADCVTHADGTVTYNECGVSGSTLNGSITTTGDEIQFDLTITVDPSAYDLSVISDMAGEESMAGLPSEVSEAAPTVNSVSAHEAGTVTVTQGSITGNVEVSVDVSMTVEVPVVGPYDTTMSVKIEAVYDVQLDKGCPTGGTLVVNQTSPNEVSATAEFGPACGDVVIK